MINNDGGYYAIKGFLYQFDKALIEILKNPDKRIEIEKREDINIENYVIQVKHKETQNYSLTKIRKPVIQLFNSFKENKSQQFCLYCYFRDKPPAQHKLDLAALDNLLGDKKNDYLLTLKNEFIDNFVIHFSNNFEKQFEELIKLIGSSFSLNSKDKAIIYHSIFRSKLLDVSIRGKKQREISKRELSSFIQSAEKNIFYLSYSKYLGRRKYEKLIRKEFFTFNRANIDNFERLFLIDCDESVDLVDINKIVNCISKKYFRLSKSPQPYVCFVNLSNDRLTELKRELVDQGVMFNDGTYFNGDKFRLERIIENQLKCKGLNIKIINIDNLDKLIKKIKFKEVYHFYIDLPKGFVKDHKYIKIQIEKTNQILKMVK